MATKVVYVNPAAIANGDGSIASPLNSWSGVDFTAGTTYLQMDDTTFDGSVTISTTATADSPITIGSYGSGAAPVINGTVTFDQAAYVSLTGFGISGGSAAAAVVIQGGSNNIQLQSNYISNSEMGVWLGNGAQGSNTISDNSIVGNSLFGIAVSGVVNPIGQETVISDNVIAQNGSDGIELGGANFSIQGNVVLQNGQTIPGSSGIHAYAAGSDNGEGDNNTITGNVVVGTGSVGSGDGNGIEVDQWTHGNTITDNTVAGNDGSGIAVYDSWNNTINQNMVYANDADPASQYGANGEIVLASTLNLTQDNTVSGNTFIGISPYTPVATVDGWSSTSGNVFTGNVFEDAGAMALYDWGGIDVGNSASYWRTVTSGSDMLGGTAPSAGTSHDYDFVLANSPLAADFRFAWQSASAYGGT